MWQYLVEIEHYSIAYFDCVTTVAQYFRYGRGSYGYVDLSGIGCSFAARMSPALSWSTALQRFECGNAVEIRNRIMFNFYPGLPHDSETEISSGYEILYTLFNYNFMYKFSHLYMKEAKCTYSKWQLIESLHLEVGCAEQVGTDLLQNQVSQKFPIISDRWPPAQT